MTPTWTRATVPATSDPDGPRLRYLLLAVEGEPVTYQLHTAGDGKAWPVLVYPTPPASPSYAHAIDDLRRVLGADEVPMPESADLEWLAGPP